MVTMRLPSTAATLVRHDFVATPSTSTVHAAHCPSPQPNFAPVRSRSSRRTLRSVRSGSTSIRRPPAVHKQFSDSGHAYYYGAGDLAGGSACPTMFLLGPLGCHFKGAIHPHHFAGELHLIA